MKILTFSAIKGGVGKSSLCILCANYLSSIGKKVLAIDLDLQNSLSFYFLTHQDEMDEKNIACALSFENLREHIIEVHEHLHIIPSSFHLVKLRAINVHTLDRLLKNIHDYDFCLIDTAPTFDNIVLNAVHASHQIITPACLSQFDWKSALFYKDQIQLESGSLDKWKLLINRFKAPRSENSDTETNQYLQLFKEEFEPYLLNTRVIETSLIQKAIDTGMRISRAKAKDKLFSSLSDLAQELFQTKSVPKEF